MHEAPVFQKIPAIKFLKLHNSILLHSGQFYRIKYHLTTIPFAPPYTVAFDLAELACTIKLDVLFFWGPLNSIAKSYIYQAQSYDNQTYRKAHCYSFTEFSGDDNSQLTMFIELAPMKYLPPYPLPDIWELDKTATNFDLIQRDERFRGHSSTTAPLESDESDLDDFHSQDIDTDSETDQLLPNGKDYTTA